MYALPCILYYYSVQNQQEIETTLIKSVNRVRKGIHNERIVFHAA